MNAKPKIVLAACASLSALVTQIKGTNVVFASIPMEIFQGAKIYAPSSGPPQMSSRQISIF
jgi:hypothetical protein